MSREPLHPLFSYALVPDDHVVKMDELRARYSRLCESIQAEIPNCRARSLAITALEESCMWAMKALSHGADSNLPRD